MRVLKNSPAIALYLRLVSLLAAAFMYECNNGINQALLQFFFSHFFDNDPIAVAEGGRMSLIEYCRSSAKEKEEQHRGHRTVYSSLL